MLEKINTLKEQIEALTASNAWCSAGARSLAEPMCSTTCRELS